MANFHPFGISYHSDITNFQPFEVSIQLEMINYNICDVSTKHKVANDYTLENFHQYENVTCHADLQHSTI